MKLEITVALDSGGSISIEGEGLSAESVNEIFELLSGYTVETTPHREEDDE